MKSVLFSWSGGKDSTLALYKVLKEKKYNIKELFTTVSAEYNRISMHGVRRELLEKQAKSLGFNIRIIKLPKDVGNDEYGVIMEKEMLLYKSKNFYHVIFGDIFLEDVREYRDSNLSKIGLKALFPLWGKNSREIAEEFINLGFQAIVTCTDSNYLDDSYIGKLYDEDFLLSLPSNVDPSGENGEFHTFVFDGPIFSYPIQFKKGEIVFRENRFYFIDLIPK
jgi:uncharacterized protein (TIGR00290 family)